MNSFLVPFAYPVIYTDSVFGESHALPDLIDQDQNDKNAIGQNETGRAIVFLDSGLHAADDSIVSLVSHSLGNRLAVPVCVVTGGENGKDGFAQVEQCAALINSANIDRHSYVIAIGGGAMLDVVGFAAAIVHRGVRLIRMPTTVLAQNDAGIGVKNGVNLFGKKNFLGSFAPPHAVVNDFALLKTLRPEQWRDGIAEAVKVGLIRDRAFVEWIETRVGLLNQRDAESFRYLIRRCAELHLQHITTNGDPFERGSARPLDFGHWAAHKIESLSGFRLSHGHAVAVGIAIDMTYAASTNLCDASVADRIIDCLKSLKFHLAIRDELGLNRSVEPILSGLREFQEHLGGALALSMVRSPGDRIEIDHVDLNLMRNAIASVLFD